MAGLYSIGPFSMWEIISTLKEDRINRVEVTLRMSELNLDIEKSGSMCSLLMSRRNMKLNAVGNEVGKKTKAEQKLQSLSLPFDLRNHNPSMYKPNPDIQPRPAPPRPAPQNKEIHSPFCLSPAISKSTFANEEISEGQTSHLISD
jgi:hypothetical protein